jgi:hypothetical protein
MSFGPWKHHSTFITLWQKATILKAIFEGTGKSSIFVEL